MPDAEFVQSLDLTAGAARVALGDRAVRQGNLAEAEFQYQAALAENPTLIAASNQLGVLYRLTGRAYLACDLLREATRIAPELPEPWLNLGNALFQLEEYDAAREAYETAMRRRPGYLKVLVNLARVYQLCLRPERGLECMREAAKHDSTSQGHSNLLFYAMFSPDFTAEEIAALAEEWDARFAAPLRGTLPPLFPRDPEAPLRIGYVGAAFQTHPVGFQVEPIIEGHDREQFISYCYSDVAKEDVVTQRFRASAASFRESATLTDEQLFEQIQQDHIDILIDLNLHTTRSRLGVFARRASPVQINYLAYPFTGGVRELDYRITDNVLDPCGSPRYGPEAILRLRSSYWLYRPDHSAPVPVPELPARRTGRITFANLNYTKKLHPALAMTWARILNRVPGSRLVQLAQSPAQQPHIARLFAEAGVDPNRIEIVGQQAYAAHLGRYQEVDLSLDPFPYGGHTTALDSLWMGVPLLTFAGPAPYSRGAASILTRLDQKQLIVDSLQAYEDAAVSMASNFDRLEHLREDLRGRMACSSLCDEKSFVADFERGLRLAWRRYCEGLPPAEIDLSARQ